MNEPAFIARDDGSLEAANPRVTDLAWSLDGTWIALLHRESASSLGFEMARRVVVVPMDAATDGDAALRIDDTLIAREMVFLPNDRLLVHRDGGGEVRVRVHELPDGGTVAAWDHRGQNAGAHPIQRARDGGVAMLRWGVSRGPSRIALIDADGRVLLDTDERTLLGRVSAAWLASRYLPASALVLDPDGTRLAVAIDATSEIDATRVAFVGLFDDTVARCPVVLPWIADMAFVGPSAVVHVVACDLRLQVRVLDRGPVPLRAIAVPVGLVGTRDGFALSPDGDAVLVPTNDQLGAVVAVHRVRLDTGEASVLRAFPPGDACAVAWSAAGEPLIAVAESDARIALYLGDDLAPVAEIPTEAAARFLRATPSPDGRWLALRWIEGGQRARLRLVPLRDR